MPMAKSTARPSAVETGVRIFSKMEERRNDRSVARRSPRTSPRADSACRRNSSLRVSDHLHSGQPERQNQRGRRAGHSGLRCGEEGQGPQAPHGRRRVGAAARTPSDNGIGPRSRRSPPTLQRGQEGLPFSRGGIRRWRLSWRSEIENRGGDPNASRNHVAQRYPKKGFKPLPIRWIVERTFGWLNRYRLLSKEFERTIVSSESDVQLCMIRLMTRRLAFG